MMNAKEIWAITLKGLAAISLGISGWAGVRVINEMDNVRDEANKMHGELEAIKIEIQYIRRDVDNLRQDMHEIHFGTAKTVKK